MKNPSLTLAAAEAPDSELAERVAAGEHAAFEVLMRRHNRALFRTARAILRDDSEVGIPEATVRTRLFRAKSLLREGLASKIDLACEEAFAFAGTRCDRIVFHVMERIK